MESLKQRIFIILLLLMSVPVLVGFLTFNEVRKMSEGSQTLSELKEAQVFFEAQSDSNWTDDRLDKAQDLRATFTRPELQLVFSNWIQAKSEGGSNFVKMRSEELMKYIDKTEANILSESKFGVERIMTFLLGGGALTILIALLTWRSLDRRMFRRLRELSREISQFRVLEYQLCIPDLDNNDEIADLRRSFYTALDILFVDLNYNLGLGENRHDEEDRSRSLDHVQDYLEERRSHIERRETSTEVDDERRETERRRA